MDVTVIALPHICNFDDFDPIAREEGVSLRYVRHPDELGAPDLVLLPGTFSTVSDLEHLRACGLAGRLAELQARRSAIIGICGGYQMLGQWIEDPRHIEADRDRVPGLGLLPVVTRFEGEKQTHQVSGRVTTGRGLLARLGGTSFRGYEIHMGLTRVRADSAMAGVETHPTDRPFSITRTPGSEAREHGCMSRDGWTLGTYVHGLFHNDDLRRAILDGVAARRGVALPRERPGFSQSGEYDKLRGSGAVQPGHGIDLCRHRVAHQPMTRARRFLQSMAPGRQTRYNPSERQPLDWTVLDRE